ncbi:peptidase inhibitor family I36 protein [Streptomyces sp. SudanB182_2057]|uniref:peptidase inhibitor family I36 protein n=1 Tax=Streptomyces sp. SudanB182_2057 TaxID=3035281 RepID=UPI003F56A48E
MRSTKLQSLVRALAVAGVLAASLAPASTASAIPNDRCPEGYVCFWTGYDFTGTMSVYNNPRFPDYLCTGIRPAARTVFNNDDQPWNFYRDTNCQQFAVALEPGDVETSDRLLSWK